jgi:hypothetical protein
MNEQLLSFLCKMNEYIEWILDFDLSIYTVFGKHEGADDRI